MGVSFFTQAMGSWPEQIRLCVSGSSAELVLHVQNTSVAEITETDSNALHYACVLGDLTIIKLLLQNGFDINERNVYGESPLHWATRQSSIEVLHFLLARGAKVTVDADDNSPLHWAAERDDVEVVKELVRDCKKYLNKKNQQDRTPIQVAIYFGNTDVVRVLLPYERDLRSTLAFAVEFDQPEIVHLLLDAGVAPEPSVILLANRLGHIECLGLLTSCTQDQSQSHNKRSISYGPSRKLHRLFTRAIKLFTRSAHRS